MATDGRYVIENNYRFSLELFRWCQEQKVPLIYASSASVYGRGPDFVEDRAYERPLNIYGYSKFLFDAVVRRQFGQSCSSGGGPAVFQRVRTARIA